MDALDTLNPSTHSAPSAPAKGDAEEVVKSYAELPHNIEAEQALLGALLIKNETLHDIADFLDADHFYEPVHRRIYASICQYVDRGLLANPVTLKPVFDKDEALKDIGGAGYLATLAGASGMLVHVKDYANAIYDLALKCALIDIGETIKSQAFDVSDEKRASDQIESAEQQLFALATHGDSERSFQALSSSVAESIARTETAYRNAGSITGLTTGFVDLDQLLGGFQESDLVILAGRPSMGKTALATTMALEAARRLYSDFQQARQRGELAADAKPKSVGFLSLEMSAEQLAGRMLASASGINSQKLRRGELVPEEFTQLVKASNELNNLPYFIDDTPALSISALRTRARRLKRMHNLSLLVVDYLQLLRGNSAAAQANRVQEISEITQGLKAVAKELNIPVIALSQLSRAVEQREDKRPQLSDLRESGSIEQDADVVMFVFREEYYLQRSMPREGSPQFEQWQQDMDTVHGIAEVIVAKQRHGPIGTRQLSFHGDTTRFGNLAKDSYTPGFEG